MAKDFLGSLKFYGMYCMIYYFLKSQILQAVFQVNDFHREIYFKYYLNIYYYLKQFKNRRAKTMVTKCQCVINHFLFCCQHLTFGLPYPIPYLCIVQCTDME